MSKRYEYVVIRMNPKDNAEQVSEKLNQYGSLGFILMQPVVQRDDRVVYTLVLEEDADHD